MANRSSRTRSSSFIARVGRSWTWPREFNLATTSIANWVRAADKHDAAAARSDGGESDKAKILRLEKELARKEEELEILGKALAFFARRVDQ
ncbi:MAG: transposase [Nocardioides sp.]